MATTSGVGSSGLDVNSIVSQLMAVEARPLTALAQKEAAYQAKVTAFNSVSGALNSFQGTLKSLSDPERFRGVNANSGDATIFTGTATSKAVAGNYNVNVTQLAKSQTITSAGQLAMNAPVGSGVKTTLTIDFGTITGGKLVDGRYVQDATATPPDPTFTVNDKKAAGTVVIDSSNNSLQGIRDAINKAGLGVTATIVSDGSANPYHLVLTSNDSGAASSMRISVAGDNAAPDAAVAGLLAYDPTATQNLTQTAAAADTKLTVNGIAVSSAKTTVDDAIQGVSLDIRKVGESTLSVSRDTDSVKAAVNGFVKSFNDLNKAIKSVTSYNADTKQAGLLLGDPAVRAIESQVRSMLSDNLTGGNLTNLTQLGITFQKDGTLAVDDSKLTKAVNNNFDDIAGLFSSVGTATDSLVEFTESSTSTKPGTRSLNVSQLATQGKLVGTAAPASLAIIAGSNDEFAMSVDGVSATVKVAAKTYASSAAFATALQAAINSSKDFASKSVSVSATAAADGTITVQSDRYGSASKVAIGGSGATNIFGATPTATDGLDVKGSIDGVEATGSGQILIGAAGSSASGMKLTIKGGATGDRGTVSFTKGFAQQLGAMVDNYVGTNGMIKSQTDGINVSIKLLDKQQAALQDRLTMTEKRLRAQYNALDQALSSMGLTQNYLTQQLTQIANLSKSS
ncbi:flagellar filament capping protein FliD [Massilia solisilvae]|uniref:Flagellar hook-associated protein 2 n=1 Tax=Massilia solisilvae TaxID=1811225 RepID=A0ABT2BEY2_9BURK|nr:flagellar filament capping protein FliD [Massilia solisilvae]